ncbi:MAG: hypothetical protein R6U04_03860 [Bacteroidales bacterium]
MNFKTILIISVLFLLSSLPAFSQEPLNHEKKIYKNSEGKLYINKDLPIYIRVATSPDSSAESFLLESEDSKDFTNPMYFDTEGFNTIRSPWKINQDTKQPVYPQEDIIFEIYADSKPPSTKIDFGTQKPVKSGETTITGEKVNLTFQASDAISGVDDIYYSTNKSQFKKYKDTIKLEEENEYLIQYYSVDNVGNVEEIQKVILQIDQSAPKTSLSIDGDKHEKIISGRSEIILSSKDTMNKVKNIYYSINEGKKKIYNKPIASEKLEEGEHSVEFYSEDLAGNKEQTQSFSFYVDKTPPSVIEEILGNSFVANGKKYYSGQNKLKLVSMDNKAGVKEISYSINNGKFKRYDKPFNLSKSGNLKIEVLAIDNVNNKKQTEKISGNSQDINYVDLSGPSLSHNFDGPSYVSKDTIFISKNTRLKLSGKDDESGFKKIEYKLKKANNTQTYEEPFSIDEEGEYLIHYTGYDNLDNTNSKKFLCVVDNKGPKIYHRFSMDPRNSKEIDGEKLPVYPSHVVLFLSATDNFSGFEEMYYSINSNDNQIYQNLIEGFKENAQYKLDVTAIDKLGNTNSKDIKFYVE